MIRKLSLIAASISFILLAGVGVSQDGQPKKEKGKEKDAKTIDQFLEPDTFKDDLKVVRERGLKGDGPDIIAYFRERTLKQPDPKEISGLVRQLGDEDFPTREAAYTKLAGLGAAALTGLKEGENDPSLEIRKRVADLKARIDTKAEPTLQVAAARVLAKLKTDGTADVLMQFLPFVNDTMVIDEICRTLGAVAVRDGRVDPMLVKALDDKLPVKRGAAGEALVRANVKEEMSHVKKLLKDSDINVRFRICMAMLTSQDREILPVMVDLMADLNPNQLWPIEEALVRLAGEKAPNVSLGNDVASRKACRDVWAKWLAENEKNVDMTRLTRDNLYLGYTLIVQYNNRIGAGMRVNVGEVYELDTKKNIRWKFEVTTYPVDAQVVGGNRVVVAEYNGNRVTERDTKGEIKWEYNCGGNPFQVQRLPNGNTFIAMQSRLIEVDRNKKEVWSMQRNQGDIIRARKLPNGDVCFITNQGVNGTYTRMEPKTQKVIKSFNVTGVQVLFGSMEVLPNGHIIVPHYQQQRVIEYNQDGGQVATFNINWPNSVVRLPNGNTLVASQNSRQIVEFDTNRNQVATHTCDGMVFVARRR
jgi:outer membrane protein assembly factor BamB